MLKIVNILSQVFKVTNVWFTTPLQLPSSSEALFGNRSPGIGFIVKFFKLLITTNRLKL